MSAWQIGRGVRRSPGQMNGLERRYADYLYRQQLGGEIIAYWFDSIKLKLASTTFWTPDFLVLMADLTLELHEVKGHWEDDARVKTKVVADKYPFRVKAIQWIKGAWVFETFGKEDEV